MAFGKRNITSAISLIGAFALGQGSLFLASTYLLLNGRSQVVTELGVAASLYSLVIWIADLGGVYYLSAYIKRRERERIRSFFYGRLLCVLLSVVLVLLAVELFDQTRWLSDVLGYGVCVAVLSCFGFGGVYDGMRRTSVVAMYASLPWVFCAIGVMVVEGIEPFGVAESVGMAFVIGHAIYVLRTMHVAYRLKFFFFPQSLVSMYREVRGAFSYLVSYAAGQFYARALLLAASGLLAPSAAAVFVYVRQIYSALSQVVLFLRRAEGVSSERRSVVSALFSRSLSSYFAIGVSCLGVLGGFVAQLVGFLDPMLATLIVSSAICLLVWSYFNRLFFYFLGLARLGSYLVLHSVTMLGLSFFVMVVTGGDVAYFFPLVEALALLVEVLVLMIVGRSLFERA